MLATLEPRSAAPARSTPRKSARSHAGDWRYPSTPRTRWGFVFAIIFSVTLHGMMIIGYDARPPKPAVVTVKEEIIQMEMPPIPPEEPEEMFEELTEMSEAPTVAVPQLAEVPSLVALNDFQQIVDLRPATTIDPNALRQMTIPVNVGRGSGGAGMANVFNLSDLDRVPEAISQTAPNYPFDAKRQGISEARVVVEFIVDSEGRVSDPRVHDTTNELFNQAAIQGVMKWKFRPGTKGGRKVATRMRVPVLFSLTDAD